MSILKQDKKYSYYVQKYRIAVLYLTILVIINVILLAIFLYLKATMPDREFYASRSNVSIIKLNPLVKKT